MEGLLLKPVSTKPCFFGMSTSNKDRMNLKKRVREEDTKAEEQTTNVRRRVGIGKWRTGSYCKSGPGD